MNTFYTNERNVQMLIYLMKAHGVKKVIASPGTTNITFVASIQNDEYFEIYSVADERSAAYMACGLAAESGEPVALTCTGATASRNYVPGLTEAFYRKLPVLAITSTQQVGRVGQLVPQVIDRSVIQKDIAVMSVQIPMIHGEEDEWACNLKLNSALLALKHRGGGPVHINLTTTYSQDFSVKSLPNYRVITRIVHHDVMPDFKVERIAIFVGAHVAWTEELTKAVDRFCSAYNAVVFCEHTSNYHGKFKANNSLVASQIKYFDPTRKMNLLIDMGEIFGAYLGVEPEEVWRVSPDGQVKDTFRKITKIFDMEVIEFFTYYAQKAESKQKNNSYYKECRAIHVAVKSKVPELPFSNAWVAEQTAGKLPEGCVLHLGILNSLRHWNFFDISNSIDCYSNTGGFGIDGIVSTIVGGCLANPDRLHFCVVGDLAFFYDLNAIANHNVTSNLRILLINNGCGTEFKNYSHFAHRFGDGADDYMAARGHYGKKSPELIKHYATDLEFEYFAATNKEEYLKNRDAFLDPNKVKKPMIFEIFTTSKDESDALYLMNHIIEEPPTTAEIAKKMAKGILGEQGIQKLKRLMKRS